MAWLTRLSPKSLSESFNEWTLVFMLAIFPPILSLLFAFFALLLKVTEPAATTRCNYHPHHQKNAQPDD